MVAEVVFKEQSTLFAPDFELIRSTMNFYVDLIKKVTPWLTPDLLKPEYRTANMFNPMFGHCYVASEVIYHMLNKKVQPYYGRDKNGIVHWWLVDEKLNIRIDATCDQYYSQNEEPPYENGVRSSFLTNDPSKRCLTVMERMKDANV